jgi:uncharacterized membrane protein YcaP (DUF421 family)
MFSELLDIVFRTFIALGVVLILARVMGRRSVAQLTLYDYVIGLVFGNVGATFAVDRSVPVLNGVVSLLACTVWILSINFIMMKTVPARKLVDPEPILVIYKGCILEDNLRKNYYTFASLLELLREQEVFDPAKVELGIIESNGQLSLIKKETVPDYPERENFGTIATHLAGRALVINGEIIERSFAHTGISKEWLLSSLKKQNLPLNEVMVAMITPDGRLYFDKRNDEAMSESDNLKE